MEDILHGLNEAQKAAVSSPAAVLQVLAPPGSGKTKTLTARVAYLIAHQKLSPWNIIVCTFTVKAANEMKERLCGFLGDQTATKLILGTFHSVARRYLTNFGHLIGLEKRFGIADTSDTTSIVKRIIKRNGFTITPSQARGRVSRYKARCMTAQQYALTPEGKEQQEFSAVFSEYEDYLLDSKLLDFDDLLLRCEELLRLHPVCVENIQAVLIDEFQDTNSVQYKLMERFAQARQTITTVGDPDQSIYGWRSAEIENLTKMQRNFPETHVATLEENYRSSAAILIAAQEVIEQDGSRPPKRLMPTHSVCTRPTLRELPRASIEARWIVSEIQRLTVLTAGLLKCSDFSILLRSASLSRLVEAELGKAGIPYRMVGGHRFFDRVEVKIVLDYLRVICYPSHSDALLRILNVPTRRIGEESAKKLIAEADKRKIPLWQLLLNLARGSTRMMDRLSKQTEQGIGSFVNLILTATKHLQDSRTATESLPGFLNWLLSKLHLEDHLRKDKPDDFDTRWANIEELVALANDQDMRAPEGNEQILDLDLPNHASLSNVHKLNTTLERLEHFLTNVALTTELQSQEHNRATEGQVVLSTIHAAKGLEWPVVFIPSAYQGCIPHSRAEDSNEERRLLYVAMTRAQALLYCSWPKQSSTNDDTVLSPFLTASSVRSYFDERGPDLGFEVVKEIAAILRRDMPSRRMIEGVMMTCERLRDDHWVCGVSKEADEDEYPGHGRNAPSMKRYKTVNRIDEYDDYVESGGLPTITAAVKSGPKQGWPGQIGMQHNSTDYRQDRRMIITTQEAMAFRKPTLSLPTTIMSARETLTLQQEQSSRQKVQSSNSAGPKVQTHQPLVKKRRAPDDTNTRTQKKIAGFFTKPMPPTPNTSIPTSYQRSMASSGALAARLPLQDIGNILTTQRTTSMNRKVHIPPGRTVSEYTNSGLKKFKPPTLLNQRTSITKISATVIMGCPEKVVGQKTDEQPML